MPTPTPTAEQIVIVSEIIITETLPRTGALVDTLTNEQWARTLNDIDEWEGGVKSSFTHIRGEVVINPNDKRLALINRVRQRLGLSLLSINAGGEIVLISANGFPLNIRSLEWF